MSKNLQEAHQERLQHYGCYTASPNTSYSTKSGFGYVNFSFMPVVPKTAMSLLYSYLLSTQKLLLPAVDGGDMKEDHPKVNEILEMIFDLLRKEKSFIHEVHNTTLQALQEEELNRTKEDEVRRQRLSQQRKKLSAAKKAAKNQ